MVLGELARRGRELCVLADEESGQTLVEYALLITLIAAVAVAAVAALGVDISGFMHNVAIAI